MRKEILRLLEDNARIQAREIAERLEMSVEAVERAIKEMESEGIIKGYRAVVDDSVFGENFVKAVIEVKVRPERDGGFNNIAERLSKFPEVYSLYLMSGGYDLLVEVKGSTLNDVASFVSGKLATIDGVISTATHFLLKKYKESGKILHEDDDYERLKVSP
jgi:DNA-binding Lrp family transcriptional regulator